ncbi:hypothetical protein [Methyloversatilis sp. XJ19-49]|uniref:hypothetical protein n=1 Tax=Methyloversatilis sp. XJ19-49 TaxID=2963429 RepID=UPI00211C2BAB|nr:hypothetical protein [Methyloversatilis sp. XJ19-49]MCQ9377868.1 hypothetical protein [Methyloversatilis sp. XJ19-49]
MFASVQKYEFAVRNLSDAILGRMAHELTENIRQNITVQQSARDCAPRRLKGLPAARGGVTVRA